MESNGFPVTQAAPLIGMCFFLFIYLMFAVLFVVVYCKIYSRAGYPWAMGLLMLIPIVNLVMMLILAFFFGKPGECGCRESGASL